MLRKSKFIPAVGAVALSFSAVALAQHTDLMLPPNAKPGECYARVFVPPTYNSVTERVQIKSASERIQVVPAEYGWEEKRVLVKEASERLELVPATYEWVEESILVKPSSKRLVEVPAVWETQTERVIDQPAHTVWKKGSGPIQKVDNATGEIMCLVEVPATYKTVTKRVLKSPATTREEEIPAEYKTVKKQVMKTPPTTRKIQIPAEYETVRVRTLVKPATVNTLQVPADYDTITRQEKVSEGRMEWRQVLCETNMTKDTIASLQRGLTKNGFYSGPIDGIVGPATLSALRSFQQNNNLPEGGLTMESLKKLGILMEN